MLLSPSSTQTSTSVPRPWLLLLLLLTVVLLSYSTALSAPFLWDDHLLVVQEVLQNQRSLGEHLLQPFWRENEGGQGHQVYFRPLTMISFALDAGWSGANPVGYHVTNLTAHVLVVALLYWLCRSFGAGLWPALFAALIFGVAPRLTHCVTWISGRTDVLAALFGLLALCIYPRHSAQRHYRHRWLRRVVAAVCLVLAMAAKEVGFAFAVMLAVDEVAWGRKKVRSLGQLALQLVLVLGALGGYAAWRWAALGSTAGSVGIESSFRWWLALEALGRYLWMSLDFFRPRVQLGDVRMPTPRYLWLGVGLLVVLATLATRQHWRERARRWPAGVWFGLGLMLVGLLPVLHLVKLPLNVVAADRFLYVPWIGLALAGASAASRLRDGQARWISMAAAAWALGAVVGTVARNRDYQSELRFWLRAVHTTPEHNTLPLHELAGVFYRSAEYSRALDGYCLVAKRNLQRFGRRPEVLARASNDLSAALSSLGRYQQAAQLQERMLARGLSTPRGVFNSALVQLHLENFQLAEQLTRRALERLPGYPAAQVVLEAIPELRRERQRISGLGGVTRTAQLARYYWRLGARPEAEAAYLRLLELPSSPQQRYEARAFLLSHGVLAAVERVVQSGPIVEPELRLVLDSRLEFRTSIQERHDELREVLPPCDPRALGL